MDSRAGRRGAKVQAGWDLGERPVFAKEHILEGGDRKGTS